MIIIVVCLDCKQKFFNTPEKNLQACPYCNSKNCRGLGYMY